MSNMEKHFLILKKWEDDHPSQYKKVKIAAASSPKVKKDERPSHMISFQLLQTGKSLRDIAAIRDITEQNGCGAHF